ncbi:MAG: hypothetical protein ACFFG0_44140 [Candidatus Thorarchaeota archaeon]
MKKKSQFLNFIFFLLLFNSMILTINALGYGVGIYENQEIIWKCNVCNKPEMEIIFGNNWDDSGIFKNLSAGKRMKWIINDIELNETIIKVNVSTWLWTYKSMWGIKDKDSLVIYYSNPNDYSPNLNFSIYTSMVPFWFPVPVGEYLGGLSLNEWYDVDNRVLPTLNVEIGGNETGYPSKNIKIIAIYNDQGILNSYKLYIEGNVVIIDISLDFLPFYVIPILIGLALAFSLGLILYIIKKNKSRINS